MITMTKGERFLLELEAERYDLSYRRRPVKAHETGLLTKEQQEIWFQAGRFAAGARDKDARRGHAQASLLATRYEDTNEFAR